MAVQFAGSRSLDERRRRRLASENDEPVSISELNSGNADVHKNSTPTSSKSKDKWRAPTPIHSLIPPRRWIVLLMVAGLFIGWASVLRTAFQWETRSIPLSQESIRLFQFKNGVLWNILPGGLLILTAQVSWVIYWFRRRSPSDYDGQYKIWFWASSVWMIVGIITMAGLQESVRQTLIEMFHIQSTALGPWLWLAPLSALVLEIVRGLDIEMGRCKTSWGLLGTSLIASVLFAAQLTGWQPFPQAAYNITFLFAMGTLIPTALLSSVICHAWHVMYVSAEAEAERDSEVILGIRKLVFLTGCGVLFVTKKIKSGIAYPFRGMILKPENTNESEANTKTKNPAKKKKEALKKKEKVVATTEIVESKEKTEAAEPKEKKEKKAWFAFLKRTKSDQPKKPRKKFFAAKKKKPKPEPATKSVEATTPERVNETVTQQKEGPLSSKLARNKKPRIRLETPKREAQDYEEEYFEESQPVARKKSNQKVHQRLDEPEDSEAPKSLDPALLKGLSKSERRKLRKEFRDAQRAAKRQN